MKDIHITKQVLERRVDCFVLMPFRPDLDEVYSKCLVPAVCSVPSLRCTRADEIYGPRPIMADVWRSIRAAHFVIADLTGRNPNVLYELGLSHAIQKPVILVCQTIEDVPFDLKHVRVVLYRNTAQGRKTLRAELEKHVRVLMRETREVHAQGKYSVLDEAGESSAELPKSTARLLSSLKSKDPARLVEILEKVKDEYENGKRWKSHDPRLIDQIRILVNNELPEVQVAAIMTLGRAGSRVHASLLYPFLSLDKPVLMEAAIASLGHLHDKFCVPRLIALSADAIAEPCIETILEALGRVGTPQAIDCLTTLVYDSRKHESVSCAALKGLTFALDGDKVLLKMEVDKLGATARAELAEGLGKMEFPYELAAKESLEKQILALCEDSDSQVRGKALTAWCLQSFKGFGGELDRKGFLAKLSKSDGAVLDQFFTALAEYKPAFTTDEAILLAEIGKKNPAVLESIVGLLRDIGDASVSDFMLWAYTTSDMNSLWVLDFFSKNPSPQAVTLLQDAISKTSDPSRVCLAAIALIRCGQEEAMSQLIATVGDAYDWVKQNARGCLMERIDNETFRSRRTAMKEVLKKLPKGVD